MSLDQNEIGTDPFRKQLVVIKQNVFCKNCRWHNWAYLELSEYSRIKESGYHHICGAKSKLIIDPIYGRKKWDGDNIMFCEIQNNDLNCQLYTEKVEKPPFSFWDWIKSLFKKKT